MIKTAYLTTYQPPIPALTISLSLPAESVRVGPFPALLDTGADTTVIPITYLRQLHAPVWTEAYLRSPWGERRRLYTYVLDLHFSEQCLPGLVVVGDEQGQEIILGRNALNQLILLLDGPQTTLYILSRLPRNLG